MKRNRAVASALATLIMAAGIDSAAAQETDASDAQAQGILCLTSVEALENELCRQRELVAENPLMARIVSRIVDVTKLSAALAMATPDRHRSGPAEPRERCGGRYRLVQPGYRPGIADGPIAASRRST